MTRHPPSSRRLPRRAVVVLLAALLALVGLSGAAGAGPQEELQQARDRLEALEEQLAETGDTVEQRRQRVREANRRVRELEQAVNEAARAVGQQEQAVDDLAARIERTRRRVEAIRAALGERARSLYQHGAPDRLAPLVAGGSLSEVLSGIATMEVLADRDQASVEQLAATRSRLREQRRRYRRELERLRDLREQRAQLLNEVEGVLEQRRQRLEAARERRESLHSEHEHLEEESQRLEEVIAERQAERRRERLRAQREAEARREAEQTAGSSSGSSGGDAAGDDDPAASRSTGSDGFVWPICGPVTSEFGYRWGRRHEGIDIDGSTGDTLRASDGGVVIYASWMSGYGRMTLIDHGSVVTAYAHQSAQYVSDGQQVARGEPIGAMGNTGNSTGSHLHFETRRNGTPVNPRRYLGGGC